jgi:hypothetical protein
MQLNYAAHLDAMIKALDDQVEAMMTPLPPPG